MVRLGLSSWPGLPYWWNPADSWSLGMEQSKCIQHGLGIPTPLKFSQFSASDANKVLHAEPGDNMLWWVASRVSLRHPWVHRCGRPLPAPGIPSACPWPALGLCCLSPSVPRPCCLASPSPRSLTLCITSHPLPHSLLKAPELKDGGGRGKGAHHCSWA